jgi:hypothetical protein
VASAERRADERGSGRYRDGRNLIDGRTEWIYAVPMIPILTPRRAASLAVALLGIGGLLAADVLAQRGRGGGGGAEGEQAQLQAGRRPVAVSFLALSPDGSPIADLRPSEVTLRVGGRNKRLVSLAYVRVPTPDLGPPFGSTQIDPGRRILLAFDEESLLPPVETPLRHALDGYLASLAAADRVGIATLPAQTVRLAPTADRAQLREALAKVTARGGGERTPGSELCRTRNTLEGLRGEVGAMTPDGSFSTVVFFSAGLSAPGMLAPELGRALSEQACEVNAQHYESIGAAVDTSGVQLRVVQADPTITERHQGLQALSSAVGAGDVLLLNSPEASPLERLAREWSGYYVATFDPENSERTDESREVELQVSRGNVTLRGPRAVAIGNLTPSATPPGMLQVPNTFREIPLRVTAVPTRLSGEQIKVLVLAEADAPSVRLTAGAVGLVSPDNKLQAVGIATEQLAGAPMLVAMEAVPGTYRLRFAATDSDNRGGAADVDVRAELVQVGPLRMSGLLLGAPREGAFTPRMQFDGDAIAIAYLELYGSASNSVSAWLEIAKTTEGPAIATVMPEAQRTAEPDKFVLIGEIPLSSLEPGDYVVRAMLEVPGLSPRRVIRTLRKVR